MDSSSSRRLQDHRVLRRLKLILQVQRRNSRISNYQSISTGYHPNVNANSNGSTLSTFPNSDNDSLAPTESCSSATSQRNANNDLRRHRRRSHNHRSHSSSGSSQKTKISRTKPKTLFSLFLYQQKIKKHVKRVAKQAPGKTITNFSSDRNLASSMISGSGAPSNPFRLTNKLQLLTLQLPNCTRFLPSSVQKLIRATSYPLSKQNLQLRLINSAAKILVNPQPGSPSTHNINSQISARNAAFVLSIVLFRSILAGQTKLQFPQPSQRFA
jgi:hypothetical protein